MKVPHVLCVTTCCIVITSACGIKFLCETKGYKPINEWRFV